MHAQQLALNSAQQVTRSPLRAKIHHVGERRTNQIPQHREPGKQTASAIMIGVGASPAQNLPVAEVSRAGART